VREHFGITDAGAAAVDIEHDDVRGKVWAIGCARVDHIDSLEVGREADAVGAAHRPFSDDAELAGLSVKAVYPSRQFELCLVPLVGPEDAVARIGKPDRAIGVNSRVIGGVQFLTL